MRARLLLAVFAALPASAAAQAGASRISGAVHDSTRGRPLTGATVVVAGGTARATTDAQGRFELAGVPAGPTQLFFLHPRLDTLEHTARSVSITAGADVRDVILAIPSLETLARESCGSEGGATRVLEGVVLTSASGLPVANALIELKWRGGNVRDTTNEYGRYRFCTVPAAERLSLHAELLGRVSSQETVVRESPLFSRHDIRLDFGADATQVKTTLRASTGALHVTGQVRDSESGAPVAAAMLRLIETPFQSLSNAQGGFSFAHVPTGDYTLEVEHIGYGKRQQRFSLPPGATVELDVQLPPAAIALKGLTVRALTSEENERRASPTANRIVGEAQLECRHAPRRQYRRHVAPAFYRAADPRRHVRSDGQQPAAGYPVHRVEARTRLHGTACSHGAAAHSYAPPGWHRLPGL